VRVDILQVGEPVLRQKARTLSVAEIASEEIRKLIAQMRETMYAGPGVGLAAPQIGFPLRLAVIEDREEYQKDISAEQLAERERRPVPFHVIINPQVTESSGEVREFFEGCLSLTGFLAVVPRARTVRVECLDERGQPQVICASGWYARILQHEIDHLNGTLYVDRMLAHTFASLDNWGRFWKGRPVSEVRAALEAPQEN
jgi:peptide deformylase